MTNYLSFTLWPQTYIGLCFDIANLLCEKPYLFVNSLRLRDGHMSINKAIWRGHYLNQCCSIVTWTLVNKLQWDFHQIAIIFIKENAFENVVCRMAAILSRPQYVNPETFIHFLSTDLGYMRMIPDSNCICNVLSDSLRPSSRDLYHKETHISLD